MPLHAPDFERLFVPGTRHDLSFGMVATVRLRQDAWLWLPTGRVVAGEPAMLGVEEGSDRAFVQRVEPGRYPLVLVIAAYDMPEDRPTQADVAAAKLVIRDEPVVSWEMALLDGQDLAELDDDEFFGYAVDSATGGFIDAANAALLQDDDVTDRMFSEIAGTEDAAATTLTDDEGRPCLVAFSSGSADGHYPTWVGRTADGEVACFLTDFFVLTDDEEDNDDE
ncbi:DUF4241 domain-containing protein [Saccharopolyspora cebuensis]|uniref:DUF4241 domain-containing protein n=1 Tax=Saccharopolyspora cebuensis TaxID=418759 RepID=A0ABV4CEY4_9PSEU